MSAALALSPPPEAAAQIRPGIERNDYWGAVRARYRNEVLQSVGVVMDAWLEAWNNDDVDGIAELLSEEAVVIVGGARRSDTDAIRSAFSETLVAAGAIETSLMDFDVRGEMAFATTAFDYVMQGGNGTSEVSGHLIWIMVRHDERWLIRSLVFQRSDG